MCLSLDEAFCTGCGICRTACPESAIEIPGVSFAPLIDARARVGYVACEKAAPAGTPGVVPCLHAIGERDIKALAREAVHRLVTATGDCAACCPAAAGRFEGAVARTNAISASRGGKPFVHEPRAAVVWRSEQAQVRKARSDLDQRRRGLFSLILPSQSDRETAGASGKCGPRDEHTQQLFRYVPRIDGTTCSGCDACVRVCRHAAITVGSDTEGPFYRIEPADCTGCRLCIDVCEDGALALHEVAELEQPMQPLTEGRCRACGAPYHVPRERPASNGLCRICQRTNHHRRLYQVRS